jgi:hypothetical protein
MRKHLTAVLLGSGAVAAALSLGASSALATARATWTVKPGGAVSASGSAQVKDASTGTVAKCTSLKLSGTLKKGSGLSGTGIGTIKSAAFTGCSVGGIAVTVTTHGLPWKLNATSYNASTGVTKGSISGIDLKATNPLCNATLDGTGAGKNNGKTNLTYTNSSGKINLVGTGNLHSYAVSGCAGLINNGDVQKASGTQTVSPKQKITSP